MRVRFTLLAALALASCEDARILSGTTAVVLEVRSPLTVGSEIDTVELVFSEPGEPAPALVQPIVLAQHGVEAFPFHVLVYRGESVLTGQVDLLGRGLSGGREVASGRLGFGFVEGAVIARAICVAPVGQSCRGAGDADADGDLDADTDADADADLDADSDTDIDSDSDVDTDVDTDADGHSDADTDADADADADTDVEDDADAAREVEAEDEGSGADSEIEALDAEAELEARAETEVEPEPEPELEPEVETECTPLDVEPCYEGEPGTQDVGLCKAGERTCDAAGSWGPCLGQVRPAFEVCDGADNDCDGLSDERFDCTVAGVDCFNYRIDWCNGGGDCVAQDAMTNCLDTYDDAAGEPWGIVDSSPTGYCGRGGMQLLLNVPPVSPVYLHVAVEVDIGQYGDTSAPGGAGLGIGPTYLDLAWAHAPGDPAQQHRYVANGAAAQHIPWNSKWIELTAWSGSQISVFVFMHDWDKTWCNSALHAATIKFDTLYYSDTVGGPPL